MAKTITTKFPATCADTQCGATISVGSKARWYGRGRIYGMDCHDKFDGGIRWVNGGAIQANGACEDAPACGCCGQFGYQVG